jgi:hypothetical protein
MVLKSLFLLTGADRRLTDLDRTESGQSGQSPLPFDGALHDRLWYETPL